MDLHIEDGDSELKFLKMALRRSNIHSMKSLAGYIEENLKRLPVKKDSDGLPYEPVRLLYGRGGRAPGCENINIDFFPPLVYVTLYEEEPRGDIDRLCRVLKSVFGDKPVLIQDRSVRPAEIRMLSGEISEELVVYESGLSFLLHPLRGQNPGFFPDMRNGRSVIRQLVETAVSENDGNVRVLNLFAYTCSLSVVALCSGASAVVNIDKNRRSLEIGRRNHVLNIDRIPGGYENQAVFLSHDIFKSFGKLKREGPYNLIIADPPPSQKGSFMMRKDYPRLMRRLPEMLAPDGRILLSLNSPAWSREEFECMILENIEGVEILRRIEPPEDFVPSEEDRGLKIIVAGMV